MGLVLNDTLILRDRRHCRKFCISPRDHSKYSYHPQFVRGAFYVLTYDLLVEIYTTAVNIVYFWIEDAFVTGFVVKSMQNVHFIDWKQYYKFHEWQFIDQYTKDVDANYFVTSSDTMYATWAASLLKLTPEDKQLIGNEEKLFTVSYKYSRGHA